MKLDLPCAIVRDLLPSYIEGLTEEETTAAVKAHLASCPDCSRRLETMKGGEEIRDADPKEVDYLKTVRKKNRKKVVLSVLLAIMLVLGGVGAKLFLIGAPADSSSTVYQVTPSPALASINISFLTTDSATVLTDLKFRTEEDVIEITGRKVLVSPVHPPEDVSLSLNLAGIREVRAFGEPIWRDGVVIERHIDFLLEHRVEFVGDAPAVNDLICSMDLDAPHTLELRTGREPYGVTIHFTDIIQENRRFMVEGHAYLLLSLIDNLGEVCWDDPSGSGDSLTLAEANAALPELTERYNDLHGTDWVCLDSVKDYCADAYRLQQLSELVGI